MMKCCFVRRTPPFSSHHYVAASCLVRKSLKDAVIDYDKQLGAGSSGTVYAVGAMLVLKVVSLTRAPTNEDEDPVELYSTYMTNKRGSFEAEVKTSIWASERGVGPKVYDHWTCSGAELTYFGELSKITLSDDLGFILMERIDGLTIEEYADTYGKEFKRNYDTIKRMLGDKLQSIAEGGYFGIDIVMTNAMIKFNDPTVVDAIVMIDFDNYHPSDNATTNWKHMMYAFRELNKLK